eukprot:NODE_229_length_2078_cov_78.608181_g197_i0.p1 GENE.NODE_229_length_2078_cov_78.608181_g197_i0~~NODE_229_length_2078_cov_78.608181_g197_i0.p1  ORF type:complete len:355 (-),score=87.91 NODE_229_length_2078_cov_78.608181_g197_i0:283-1347(-)
MQVLANSGWVPIRAALRYVTQAPWNRLPIHTRTFIMNGVGPCLAGGRNKATAAFAYEMFNAEHRHEGLQISTPATRVETWDKLDGLLEEMKYMVVKVPYSNAGQGVWPVTSRSALESLKQQHKGKSYDKLLVQQLLGPQQWDTNGGIYQVGCLPDDNGAVHAFDTRVMVGGGPNGFQIIAMYARQAAVAFEEVPPTDVEAASQMLCTNLSVKLGENHFTTQPERLLPMDIRNFDILGIGIDDLVEGFVQSVMAMTAIDVLCQRLMPKNQFSFPLFQRICDDNTLLQEIRCGNPLLKATPGAADIAIFNISSSTLPATPESFGSRRHVSTRQTVGHCYCGACNPDTLQTESSCVC